MNKSIFVFGLDQLWVQRLREEGYEVVIQRERPEANTLQDHVLVLTSDQAPTERLHEIRQDFPDATIMYLHLGQNGLRESLHVHAAAATHGIEYLSPRATVETLLQKLETIFETKSESAARIVGFFGSGMGVGVTSLAATFASQLARHQKVILLGLDLFHPGWYERPTVSLDAWQPRLTGKVLQTSDFDMLIEHGGFLYLPGNYDILAIQQYTEEEMEYLIEKAREAADIVVLDCGSVPESAGWYVGLQKASIRYFVTHPAHHHTIRPIMDVVRHLDMDSSMFQLIVNRVDVDGGYLKGSDLAAEYQMLWSGIEIPSISMPLDVIVLPLGKKELNAVATAANGAMRAFGIEADRKKGGLFR
mgnify:FL=1|jgi:hypothetical protein